MHTSRLHAESLESYHSALLLIHTHDIVFCPCAAELHPENLDLPISCLLHRIDDRLVLALEARLLDLFDLLVTSYEFFQAVYTCISLIVRVVLL